MSAKRSVFFPTPNKGSTLLISHAHKFILVKPRKVAGTSVELAFCPHLLPGDMATPIEPHEEPLRSCVDGVQIGRIGGKLRDHSPLEKAYSTLGDSLRSYRVITVERNPWDRAVSQFFWTMRHGDMRQQDFSTQKAAFAKFTRRWGPKTWEDRLWGRKRQRSLSSYDLYSIGGKSRADFVIFFESLAADLARCGTWLGLEAPVELAGQTKGASRPKDTRHWSAFFDDGLKDFVAHHCRREIAAYGYTFDGQTAPTFTPSAQL